MKNPLRINKPVDKYDECRIKRVRVYSIDILCLFTFKENWVDQTVRRDEEEAVSCQLQ